MTRQAAAPAADSVEIASNEHDSPQAGAQGIETSGVDFDELRSRAESIGAGVRLTLAQCAAGWFYVAATWDQPDRKLIASLFGIGAIVALLFVLIPHERVVRSRWREPFFVLWSLTNIGLTAVVASADGGSTSPLALLSRADPLTGCLNRRGFEERFDAELSRAQRTGLPVGLIMLDLDHFKEINDTRGHAAGDDVLRWAVEVMNDVVRPMDVVGRIGGDEFAVAVPGAGPDDSMTVAKRLQEALSDRAPASIGVACFPTDGADREELQRSADIGLYAGKRDRPEKLKMISKEL